MPRRPLRIGTRGSPMALAQTGMVRDRIAAAHPDLAEPGAMELVVVTTVADKVLDRPLSEIGGKGLFTKELEQALLTDQVDIAVHSMKDVETWLPDGSSSPASWSGTTRATPSCRRGRGASPPWPRAAGSAPRPCAAAPRC